MRATGGLILVLCTLIFMALLFAQSADINLRAILGELV